MISILLFFFQVKNIAMVVLKVNTVIVIIANVSMDTVLAVDTVDAEVENITKNHHFTEANLPYIDIQTVDFE